MERGLEAGSAALAAAIILDFAPSGGMQTLLVMGDSGFIGCMLLRVANVGESGRFSRIVRFEYR